MSTTMCGKSCIWWFAIVFTSFLVESGATGSNLTCYQCEKRNSKEECDLRDLKPCTSTFDRCAIHFTKNEKDGLVIKRTCGLAPCGFDDEMMTKGLGMTCDRSKPSYNCVTCCKTNGCNKNAAAQRAKSFILLLVVMSLVILNVTKEYIPPYFLRNSFD